MNIVILGTAQASMNLAPFANDDWNVWACSPGTYNVPKIHRFFELHRWEPGQSWFQPDYIRFLEQFEGPVYMSSKVASVKNCTLLPWKELVAIYGPYFFTSSIAWMMAMAIEAGAKKIALYGVDMAHNTEYKDQRLGCQYMATIARAQGIEVGVPPESDLFRPAALYGVCEGSHSWIKQTQRSRELAARLNTLEQDMLAKRDEINHIKGAMDDLDWQVTSWFGGADDISIEFIEPALVPALEPGVKGVITAKQEPMTATEVVANRESYLNATKEEHRNA